MTGSTTTLEYCAILEHSSWNFLMHGVKVTVSVFIAAGEKVTVSVFIAAGDFSYRTL